VLGIFTLYGDTRLEAELLGLTILPGPHPYGIARVSSAQSADDGVKRAAVLAHLESVR
jgi:hypothetical protein